MPDPFDTDLFDTDPFNILQEKYPEDMEVMYASLKAASLDSDYHVRILLEMVGGNYEELHAVIMDGTLKQKYLDYVLR